MPVPSACATPKSSPWTEEREARALRLYLREGFTAAEVAEALGDGFSRNAVIAKIRRLGATKRTSPTLTQPPPSVRPARRRERTVCRLPPLRPPVPLPPLREAPATGTPRTLAALAPGLCRWPIDDPGPGRMHLALFCAGPAADRRYCAVHAAIAYRVQPQGTPADQELPK